MQKSQLRAARAMLDWSQEELSKRSGVSIPTIKRLEPGTGELSARPETLNKLIRALEAHGIVFLEKPRVGLELQVATAVASVVQGRRCVLIHTSPYEPAIAILPSDALREAKAVRKDGNEEWASSLEQAAHEAKKLPLKDDS
ncbi:MAG: helix-turn-helix transcriptional regulator [Roseibium sp.]|uniref:helix-turn-helix domain-containing protein n=1 Tax=Roseibium sp. TaxID=1936156 RepID=UPI00262CE8D8|nr:helix-turn-helix transcriptional regulator [Roseibium sp.]MCV0429019.1 helix-turn-helix transcriptional regulator [Roseibium sp.]